MATASALAIGGVTLLMYSLSIEQLPEFTWNDLTGTFFAVCTTGMLVVGTIVLYCLSAGYFARSALEGVYPEAALPEPASAVSADAADKPYARLIRGPFISGATCFSVLAWVALFVSVSNQKLISPYNGRLVGALVTSLVSVMVLLLIDWRRFRRQWPRHFFLSLFSGAVVMLVAVIVAWSIGPDKLTLEETNSAPHLPVTINWSSYSVAVLDHAIAIGVSVAIAMALLLNLRIFASHMSRFVHWLLMLTSWKSPTWLARSFSLTSHVLVGSAPDRRLMRAKMRVTAVFSLFTIGVFMTAFAMASMGSAHDWPQNFFFIVTLLIVLNWASFSVRHWKGRASLGVVTAAMVFLSYPLLVRNPVMFPKMVVSLLGLGNQRLSVVALSSKQCATLAPYGVSCVTDNEKAITLTNVNLLSRLGSSMVLELLINDERAAANEKEKISAPTGAARQSSSKVQVPQAVMPLMATPQMDEKSSSAKFCDALLASQLEPNDEISRRGLRCVKLVVPKEQVFGYSTEKWRSYRGGYTAYRPGPAKAPMTVQVLREESRSLGRAASVAPILQ